MATPRANKLILLLGLMAASAIGDEAGERAEAEPPAADRPPVAAEAPEVELERRVEARTERAKREAEFNRLDRDGDGYLSLEELRAKKDLSPGPDVLDRDNDGRISRSEFAAVERSEIGPERPTDERRVDGESEAAHREPGGSDSERRR